MSYTDELLASKFDDIERDIGDMIEISNRKLPSIHIVPKDEHPLPKGPIEALGAELTEAAKKCEETVAGVHSMVNEIKELAASYREEGKRYFLQIEECSLMTSEVRTVCEALKKKIATTIAA
jgi:pentose-5-phosphate-3-epimerase